MTCLDGAEFRFFLSKDELDYSIAAKHFLFTYFGDGNHFTFQTVGQVPNSDLVIVRQIHDGQRRRIIKVELEDSYSEYAFELTSKSSPNEAIYSGKLR